MESRLKTHWVQSPDKNYLGHWDLPENGDLILTIESAEWKEVENPRKKKGEDNDFKRVIEFVEDAKPLICNQTNAESIFKATGIKYMEDSKGLKISLYATSTRVKGETVGCIRIRNESKKLPELNPNHKSWDGAKEAIKKGDYTIDQIKKKYELSTENEKLLCL